MTNTLQFKPVSAQDWEIFPWGQIDSRFVHSCLTGYYAIVGCLTIPATKMDGLSQNLA